MTDQTIAARVYAVIRKIPNGKVATYGQVAALAGLPRRARLVGKLLSDTPADVEIPWHRVVNAQGAVSERRARWDSGSEMLQRIRLEAEGVVFSDTGKIKLSQYQWMPK